MGCGRTSARLVTDALMDQVPRAEMKACVAEGSRFRCVTQDIGASKAASVGGSPQTHCCRRRREALLGVLLGEGPDGMPLKALAALDAIHQGHSFDDSRWGYNVQDFCHKILREKIQSLSAILHTAFGCSLHAQT